jgi:glycine betaine/proline transport system ATP-binding protein
MLKKTIVFITHDFDEAIRLADRIAIMKDGAVEQTGTPEDLVLAPATAYVAEFTRDVPKAKVLTVASVMTPAHERRHRRRGRGGERIAAVAAAASHATAPFAVVDAGRQRIGAVDPRGVADVLLQG